MDYVNDPLVGYISDRVRSRWGRRRPFLLFGFLPFAVAFALLWWRPPIAGQVGLAIYYAIAYLLYDTAATLVYMPYFALTPELTMDYDERTSLTSYRAAFSIVGSLVAFIVPMMIIGTMQPENAGRVTLMAFALAWSAPSRCSPSFCARANAPSSRNRPNPAFATRSAPSSTTGLFSLPWASTS